MKLRIPEWLKSFNWRWLFLGQPMNKDFELPKLTEVKNNKLKCDCGFQCDLPTDAKEVTCPKCFAIWRKQ